MEQHRRCRWDQLRARGPLQQHPLPIRQTLKQPKQPQQQSAHTRQRNQPRFGIWAGPVDEAVVAVAAVAVVCASVSLKLSL